jgi:formate-dependent nitrite reductase membrane component NrfD
MIRRPGEEVRKTIGSRDGRNIDPEVGSLTGEGSLQRVRCLDAPPHGESDWMKRLPADAAEAEGPSYYDVPLLKEPVWKWYVPAYFYVGGLAGGCAVLGAAADLAGGRGMEDLSRRCRIAASAGAGVSAALLIADLGRPGRFLNMLRVFRPSSPMNVGTWILSAFGACAGLATLSAMLPLPRPVRRAGDAAWMLAGLIGLPLTGYTGVLISNTAVPLWQGARRMLPILFSCSGAAAAAAMLELFPARGPGAEAAHRFGIAAKATEIAASFALEREVALVPRVARPLRTGFSGTLWRGAQALSFASLVLALAGGKRRRLPGVLGTAGALALRFALLQGGRRSARDPRATFEQQREGRGASELVRPKKPHGRDTEQSPGTRETGLVEDGGARS